MKKYAVAILSLFDNLNKIEVVEAENELEAMKKAFIQNSSEEYREDAEIWMKGDSIASIKDVELLCREFFDSDLCISHPLEI